ncbi:beta-galactosidase-1-like protein 3 [Sitophilus oryzae]|uniref:Beta-galactosidase n=1 Tax=Sitophilus oryzae TaxID=7048 RepID=A0A6J2XEN4_SITOR|nr:beta-galactosidase-1-like protein 3 [Sitophilus oryzae]
MARYSLVLLSLSTLALALSANSEDLPTNYEYYTDGGISSGLNANQTYFTLNGKNITIFSGTFHYFRVHSAYWRDRLRKIRAAGLNAVETYVSWNLHEFYSGQYDFGKGGSDFQDFLDVEQFLKIAQEEDLFVLLRSGPYICAEWEFGGLPAWLLREDGIKVRTNDEVYLGYVSRYFKELFKILAPLQFTNGGPIIAFQVENEYGNTYNSDSDYLHSLIKILKENNVTELLYTSDPPSAGTRGALPNEILMTANFNTDAKDNLDKLNGFQTNKPTMTMEYWSGWFDHFTETHHTVSVETYQQVYEDILSYPSSVNIYMFVGSTNFGFTAGAGYDSEGLENWGLQPTVTSYDYDAPISESGAIIDKYNATAELIAKYNPIKTRLPDVPASEQTGVYADIEIKQQILLSEIIDSYPDKIASENLISMEKLPINNNSGQNFGYVVYRKTNLTLNSNALLLISGYVRDHVLVLVNGKLINPVLSSLDDLNNFGYWRLKDSNITLTDEALQNATLDLVVENLSRNNFGTLDRFQQFKGLIDEVLIDGVSIKNWEIVPLEFKKSWNRNLTGWHEIQNKVATPALYRGTFEVAVPDVDTYINVQDWVKGIVIVNGFVLGRVFAVGPQQALYLPKALLAVNNEIIIFEHFTASDYIKFSADPIYGLGNSIKQ